MIKENLNEENENNKISTGFAIIKKKLFKNLN